MTENGTEEDFMDAREQALAINIIKGVHPKYKTEYLVYLRNCKLEGNDYYPKTLTEAFNTMSRWGLHGTTMSTGVDGSEGVTFVNNRQDAKNNDNSSQKKKIKCFNCGKEGHYANSSTNPSKADGDEESEGEDNGNHGTAICMTGDKSQHNISEANCAPAFSSSQSKACIPKHWILPHNQTTIDLFCNHELLINVQVPPSSMKVICNAGS